MHPDLTTLLDLQARDLELLQIDGKLQQLDNEVATLDAELARTRDGVNSAQREIEAEIKRRDELESKIEAHRKHQEKRREKLEFMKTQKEVAGLLAEIDLAKGALNAEEADWVKSSDQVTQLEMKKLEAEQKVAEVEKLQDPARAGLTERRQALNQERNGIRSRRETSAQAVRKPLLQRYDKLRLSNSERTVVVVALAGAACGACFTTVPVNRRGQIRSGTVIEGCENCGVILYANE